MRARASGEEKWLAWWWPGVWWLGMGSRRVRARSNPDSRSGGDVMEDLSSILQGVHVPCWIFDENGIFVWLNDAFVSTFGDRLGAHYSVVFPPESLEGAARHFEVMRRDDPVAEVELDMLRPDGSRAHTEISSILLEGIGLCCGVFGLAGTPVRPQLAAPNSLTPRQVDVLLLLSGGASTDQIARELFLSKTTVRNHVSQILHILGVHSRLAAVAKARNEGLIGD
jgi:DNA-binding CsgD family transcriptional regulator